VRVDKFANRAKRCDFLPSDVPSVENMVIEADTCLVRAIITDPVMSGKSISHLIGPINTLFVEGLPVSFSHVKMTEALNRVFRIETFMLNSELNSDRECAVKVVYLSSQRLSNRRFSIRRLSNRRLPTPN